MILSVCDIPEVLKVMRIVNIIITIIRIAVPILLIVSSMISYMNAIKDNDDSGYYKRAHVYDCRNLY